MMGAFPTGDVTTTNLDAATDNPGSARADLLVAAQRINSILASFADALGICDLDASGFVPATRLDNALKKANNLSDATASTARTNLGGTATGVSVFTAASAAAGLASLAGLPLAGGTMTGAIAYAADPSADNELSRKKYIDDQLALKQGVLAAAVITEEQTSGTPGGDFTQDTWQKRVINTEIDPSAFVTLASGVMTLQAGTYLLRAWATAYNVFRHKCRIRNTSDNTDVAIGSNEYAPTTTQNPSQVSGLVTIAGAKNFELQHRCQSSNPSHGLGSPLSDGVAEVYAQVTILQIA